VHLSLDGTELDFVYYFWPIVVQAVVLIAVIFGMWLAYGSVHELPFWAKRVNLRPIVHSPLQRIGIQNLPPYWIQATLMLERKFEFSHVAYHGYLVEWHTPDPLAETVFVLTLGEENKPITCIPIACVNSAKKSSPGADSQLTTASWNSQFVPFRRMVRERKRDSVVDGMIQGFVDVADVAG